MNPTPPDKETHSPEAGEGAYCAPLEKMSQPVFVPSGRTIADINEALEKAGAAGGGVVNLEAGVTYSKR